MSDAGVMLEAGRPARRVTPAAIAGWVVLVGGFVLPPRGVGVPLCPSKLMTGVPCPGCGLTRSVSSLAHAEWSLSWAYHPFGIAVVVVAAWFALQPFMNTGFVHRVHRSRLMRLVGLAFLVLFVGHGLVRAGLWIAGDRSIAAAAPDGG